MRAALGMVRKEGWKVEIMWDKDAQAGKWWKPDSVLLCGHRVPHQQLHGMRNMGHGGDAIPLPSHSSSPQPCRRGQGWQGHPGAHCPPRRWGGLRWRWAGWWRRRRRWGEWGAGTPVRAAGGRAVGRWRGEAGWLPLAGGRVSWESAGVRPWQWVAPGLTLEGELWREDRAWLSPMCTAKPGPSVAMAATRCQGPKESWTLSLNPGYLSLQVFLG